jgi:DNA ligase (NAD+)
MPCECPACFNRVLAKGVDLYCTGGRFGCEAIALKSTEYLLRTLGAENITSKTLEKIGVYTIENAYELTDYDILENDGFGPKSANIIIGEIQKTLRTTPEKLLQAFGIPGVGSEISRSLLKCFGDIESILYASPDELTECEGVGPKIAKNICNESSYCIHVYKYLLKKGLKFVNESNNNSLNGKQFALTGKGPMSREDISRMIEQSGGVVKGISKSTNYLVTSDTSSESGKMEKARKYGTQIISYDDLLNMLGE